MDDRTLNLGDDKMKWRQSNKRRHAICVASALWIRFAFHEILPPESGIPPLIFFIGFSYKDL